MKAVKLIKKLSKKNQPTKFKVSTIEIAKFIPSDSEGPAFHFVSLAMTKGRLFVAAKKIKNNFIAYYLLLANASPKKLQPYYHTFIYTLIRKIARPVIKFQQKTSRVQFSGYLPSLTKRGISAAVIIAIIFVQVMNVGAFEAHVINATATVANDIPLIAPNGGQFCNIDDATITIATTLAGADIIYNTDDTSLNCPATGQAYTGPFTLTETANVKARTCHGGKQSAIATSTFQISADYCASVCGNNNLEPGEQCDDGNTQPGDGCNSSCQFDNPPTPESETCDGSDNDLNGIVDDVYENKIASSSPNLTRLDNLFNVTASTTLSDDNFASQTATGANETYIYLNWVFPQIATTSLIATSTLYLEHHETNASTTVEWWNGSSYQQVCDPSESGSDTVDSCNLTSILNSASLAKNVALRLAIDSLTGTATEYLDWAKMEIEYTQPVNCSLILCGNGTVNTDETCDDGNRINQDGCSSTCQTEPATSCVKINEVYYDVNSGHGSEGTNEWVELYNACNFAVNLNGWTIKDNSTNVSASTTIQDLNLVIHNFAVLSPASTTWAFWNIPVEAEEIELGDNIGNGLGNIGDQLTLKDNNGIIADQVSYGADHTYFNLSLIQPSSTDGLSIARIVKGIDTDTAADWAYLANPNPGTNPHPRISPPIINQSDNIIETEIQAELIPDDGNLNDNDETSDLPESASADENINSDQPTEEPSDEEVITPEQEIIEVGGQTVETDETVETTEPIENDQTANNDIENLNNPSSEAEEIQTELEPAIIEPEPESAPTEESTVVIEAPKEQATEPAVISTELMPNSETTTL